MTSPPVAAVPFTGTRRFQVIQALGEGGMGLVYEALDRERGVRVALKTLRWRHPEHLLLFKSEFRALQDLHHRNLIRLDELIEEDGSWFLTMELLDGTDLISHVRPGGQSWERATASFNPDQTEPNPNVTERPPAVPAPAAFHERKLRAALAELASGLNALHQVRLIHRDIKPSNIMINHDGRVVLLDFGLVIDAEPEDVRRGQIVGTVEYMAPEQAAGRGVGPAADWYAVGVVLYEALTGRPPFMGSIMQVLQRKQLAQPLAPHLLSHGIPEDLERLCLQLLERDPARRPDGAEVLRRLHAVGPPAELPARELFVGRDTELAALQALLATTRLGSPARVLLSGEAGVGKSALALEFLQRAQAAQPEPLVLRSRCVARESVQYKAWDGVIDALSGHLSRSIDAAPEGAGALIRLFPVLERVPSLAGGGELPADAHDLRRAAVEALREILGRIARERPLILFIEDLHFADADSLTLLSALFRSSRPPPLLLVGTARDPDAALRAQATMHLTLGRLPPDETRRLALELEPKLSGTPALEELVRESGGHPLFVHQMARHAPLSLTESLWADLRLLPKDALTVMEVMAVADGPLEQRIAERASNIAEFHAKVALLTAKKLLRSAGSRRYDLVEVAHDCVRAAVMAQLGEERTRELHARLAEALTTGGAGEVDHFAAAGDAASALASCRIAAEQAFWGLAFARSAELYDKALAMAPDDEQRCRLHTALGDVYVASGHNVMAADSYRHAAALAGDRRRGDFLRKAGAQLLQSGRLAEGMALLEDALGKVGLRLPRTTSGAIASLLWQRARIRMRGLRFEMRHEDEVDPALLSLIDLTFSISSSLPLVDGLRGAVFQARNLLLALSAGEPSRLAHALCFEAGYLATAGADAQQRVAEALELARHLAHETGDPHARAAVLAAIGSAACLRGDFGAAIERLYKTERTLATFPTAGYHRAPLGSIICWALYYRGELAQLARRVDEGMVAARERGDLLLASSLSSGFANLAWLVRDDVEGARQAVAEAMRFFPPRPFQTQHLFGVIAECQIDLYCGEPGRALERMQAVWTVVRRLGLPRRPFFNAIRLHMRGRASAGCGKMTQVLKDCEALDAEGAPWTAALAASLRAAVAADRGTRLLDAALECDAQGLALVAAACRLAGSDESARQQARDWMLQQGVRSPEKLARVFIP